jgi:hypothetical protein
MSDVNRPEDDPGANTVMFQKFVEQPGAERRPGRNAMIAVAAVVVVLVILAVVLALVL